LTSKAGLRVPPFFSPKPTLKSWERCPEGLYHELVVDKARSALRPGQAAGDIIVSEDADDELEVAQYLALRDDAAVGLMKTMKRALRAKQRTWRFWGWRSRY